MDVFGEVTIVVIRTQKKTNNTLREVAQQMMQPLTKRFLIKDHAEIDQGIFSGDVTKDREYIWNHPECIIIDKN